MIKHFYRDRPILYFVRAGWGPCKNVKQIVDSQLIARHVRARGSRPGRRGKVVPPPRRTRHSAGSPGSFASGAVVVDPRTELEDRNRHGRIEPDNVRGIAANGTEGCENQAQGQPRFDHECTPILAECPAGKVFHESLMKRSAFASEGGARQGFGSCNV